jgi:hypothetical protein
MKQEQYDKLKESGWSGILMHYGKAKISNRITLEEYDKAITYWAQEFGKKVSKSPSGTPAKKEKPRNKTYNEPPADAVERLVKEFGTLKDTGENIEL